MILFADFALPAELPTWAIVFALVTVSLLFVSFFFWMVFRHAGKGRQFSHLERMKALDVGKPIEASVAAEPEDRPSKFLHNAFWIAFWVGAVVPMSALSAASSIIIQGHVQEFSLVLAIWICVAVISVSSVIAATTLMVRCRNRIPLVGDRPTTRLD